MSLLDDDDLAYMRETQEEARPTAATLYRRQARIPDGTGGFTEGYPPSGEPVSVRLNAAVDNTSSGDVPEPLSDRYGATDLVRVHATVEGAPVKTHDRLIVGAVRYLVVSDAFVGDWTTTAIVWAVREK